MERDKYFKELTRALAKEDIGTKQVVNGRLQSLMGDQIIGRVEPNGNIYRALGDITTANARSLYYQAEGIAGVVHEYLSEMENGSPMLVGGDIYSRLCEFNHTVLGGREMSTGDYQFATWLRENDGSLSSGNYYADKYTKAKGNFAERANLVSHDRLFSKKQLVEIYRCTKDVLLGDFEMTAEQERLIEDVEEQIERAVPDLQECIAQSVADFGQTMQLGE